jgi:hypothetical protein
MRDIIRQKLADALVFELPALTPRDVRLPKLPRRAHALETAVQIELERRGSERGYVRTPEGFEVDFLATPITGKPTLIQICADLSDPATRAREFRALQSARRLHRRLPALLLTLTANDAAVAQAEAPKWVKVQAAWEWLLISAE